MKLKLKSMSETLLTVEQKLFIKSQDMFGYSEAIRRRNKKIISLL